MARPFLTTFLAASFLAVSDPASGAKPAPPPPPPTTTAPELAYVRITGGGRRFYELRMANEDGTGAKTIFSSRDVGQMMVELGPRADRILLLVQGGRLSLMKYDITSSGPVMTSLEQIIDMAHAGAATAAIAPTGSHIAYVRSGGELWTYSLASKSFAKIVETGGYLGGLDFSQDGQTIYYLEQVGPENLILKSIPTAGGGPTALGPQGFFTELSAAPNGDLYLTSLQGGIERLYRYSPGGGAPEYVTTGYATSVKCDSARLIVQRINPDNTVSLVQREIQAGTENYFSRKEFYWPDYMPTC